MLLALRSGGVDNWQWHHEAYREYAKTIAGTPWDDGSAEDME